MIILEIFEISKDVSVDINSEVDRKYYIKKRDPSDFKYWAIVGRRMRVKKADFFSQQFIKTCRLSFV